MIPAELAAHAERTFGAAGREWVRGLPDLVADLERRWSIRTGGALGMGVTSVVLAADTVPGEEALALKLSWVEEENRDEAEALRLYAGRGAVRLLDADPERGALLLERLDPGWSLLGLAEEAAIPIACGILRGLWRPAPAHFRRLGDVAVGWADALPERFRTRPGPIAERLVSEAAELARDLAATASREFLLHQDAHHGNFLAGQREPWVAIDPKPIAGDPAYDLAPQLRGRWGEPDSVERTRERLRLLAGATGLDAQRIRGWAIVQNLAWLSQPPTPWEVEAASRLAAV